MTDQNLPKLYIVTPPQFDAEVFADRLASLLDAVEIACVRLDLTTRDETVLLRSADTLRAVTDARDVALVIRDQWTIADRTGIDGVHLSDGSRNVRAARKALGSDAIVGAHCGASRHDGMTAGEAGADYVSFGPLGGAVPDPESLADGDLFEWWSEMIEIPVVAEGGLTESLVSSLSQTTDFLAFGEEIWSDPDPVARLKALQTALR